MKVFGISGYSGSGKTTLIERVLPVLAARGLKVAVLKLLNMWRCKLRHLTHWLLMKRMYLPIF